jgi:hypothetical protein
MQAEFQAELYSLKCLGKAEYGCKYHEFVYLF